MSEITDTPRRTRDSAQITDRLRFELSNGYYAPGGRFYSNNTLATEYGISAPTAGKVLDALCRDGLVERVHGSGTYVTERAAGQRVTTYAVIAWLQMGHPLLRLSERYKIVAGFESACTADGRNARVINLDDDDHADRLQALLADGLDGALLLPPLEHPAMLAMFATLRDRGVPMVFWSDNDQPSALRDACTQLRFDSVQCGRIATEHLLALGHRTIAAVYRSTDETWGPQRVEGYHEAMAKARIPKRERFQELIPEGGMTPSKLVAMLRRLQDQGCTAIVASNDVLAQELILAGRAAGIRFPEDMSLTGVDNLELAVLLGLTTVDQPATDLASTALAVLEGKTSAPVPPSRVTIPCRLIARTSAGKLSASTQPRPPYRSIPHAPSSTSPATSRYPD